MLFSLVDFCPRCAFWGLTEMLAGGATRGGARTGWDRDIQCQAHKHPQFHEEDLSLLPKRVFCSSELGQGVT